MLNLAHLVYRTDVTPMTFQLQQPIYESYSIIQAS
uniref:Uncharacterized protein n=1 Tax=Arundo donax TaxID=35708 RepID=A0A0A9B0S5_ARUDO